MLGLVWVELELDFARIGLGDAAEAAAAGAEVTEDHEGGGTAREALVNVGATGGFADGMEMKRTQFTLKRRDSLKFVLRLA